MKRGLSSKQRILLAASEVVEDLGAGHLTIEAVAEKAELSKGGLLYHYPSKRELLAGMLEYLLEQVEHRIDDNGVNIGENHDVLEDSGVGLAELIKAQQGRGDIERIMSRAILAAAAEDPTLLDPARTTLSGWFDSATQESEYGLLLLLAIEGLRFIEMLNLIELPKDKQEHLYSQMIELSQVSRS